MKGTLALVVAVAMGIAWALGPALQALAGFDATLLWLDPTSARWALAALGAAWVLGWALTGLLAFRLPWMEGARAAGLGSLAWVLGRFWPKVLSVPLPPPHDLPQRKLQIFLAGLFLMALSATLALLLRSAWKFSPWARLSPRQWALRFGALAWGIYLLSGLWTWRWHMTGDAPIYMLMAADLAHDHSLDVQPGFNRQEWKRFYDLDRVLEPQDAPQASGTRYVEHRPFSAFLIAPFYAVGGPGGMLWVQSLFAALAAGLFYLVLRVQRFGSKEALLGFALFSFGAPWWTYSVNLHIEVLGGLLAWVWLCAWIQALPSVLAWVMPMALIWTAMRFNPTAAVFSVGSAWQARRIRGWVLGALGCFGISVLGYAWLSKVHTGMINPVEQNQTLSANLRSIIDPLGIVWHFFGVLMDQEFGMLTYSPPLVLAFAGAIALWRRRDPILWPLGLWIVPYGGLICSTTWWYGSMNPDRYIIFLVPALAYLAAEGWKLFRFNAWTWGLVLAGWMGALVLQVLPWFTYSKLDGASWPLKIIGKALHHDLVGYFPSYFMPNRAAWVWALMMSLFLVWFLRKAWAQVSQP